MSRIITYKEGRYSTIQLDSGEKVMLSVAQTGIVIFQMKFLGMVPGRKIAEWALHDLPDFISRLGGASPTGSPFQYAVDRIASFPSIRELESALTDIHNCYAQIMSEDEAQNIVYAFIDVVSEGAAIVCDIDRLKHPKETISRAFEIHIEGYEQLRKISPDIFKLKGYDKQVDGLKAMWIRLDDFKDIAPSDKSAIAALMTERLPSDETMKVMIKYLPS